MSKQAIEYLKKYKNQFSSQALFESLQKAGYETDDIRQSMVEVFGQTPLSSQSSQVEEEHRFWDFSIAWRSYTKAEKIKDFIFGFLLPWLTLLILFMIDDDIAWVSIIFYFAYLKFFYKKRKYIFRGLLIAIGITAVVFVVGFVLLWMAFGRW